MAVMQLPPNKKINKSAKQPAAILTAGIVPTVAAGRYNPGKRS